MSNVRLGQAKLVLRRGTLVKNALAFSIHSLVVVTKENLLLTCKSLIIPADVRVYDRKHGLLTKKKIA